MALNQLYKGISNERTNNKWKEYEANISPQIKEKLE